MLWVREGEPGDTHRDTPGERRATRVEVLSSMTETDSKAKESAAKWYVLRVQSNKEDAVRENLEKRIAAAGLVDQIVSVHAHRHSLQVPPPAAG